MGGSSAENPDFPAAGQSIFRMNGPWPLALILFSRRLSWRERGFGASQWKSKTELSQ
jgi:hypothetical protein